LTVFPHKPLFRSLLDVGSAALALDIALAAAVAAIVQLGRAVPGDKTMLDALLPAIEALGPVGVQPAGVEPVAARYARAAAAARAGADATIPIVARRGRASYLGERSAGHRDPGATSSAMLVEALAIAYATQTP
jgi:dihydroxyacetone kinase-like protein